MVTVYRLNVNELNEQFIEALQALFKDREVEITVTEVDETEYLLRSEPDGYLYPASMFVAIELPAEAKRVLVMA